MFSLISQEFIPSGRQQALRHPGPLDTTEAKKPISDDLLLNKFEKVSFRDSDHSERWFLRKSPNDIVSVKNNVCTQDDKDECIGDSSLDFKNELNTPCNKMFKRASDANLSRLIGKRFINEEEDRQEHRLRFGKYEVTN